MMNFEITKTEVNTKSRKLKEPVKTEPTPDKHSDSYYTHHMEAFKKFNSRGYTSIDVLLFLIGKQWDDVALAYVHALRPSSIRVTTGMETLDSSTWRVTVVVDDNDLIKSIQQEVEVGLPENVAHGAALKMALEYGIDSEQCQWHSGEHEGYLMSADGYFKLTKDGWVKFPSPEDPFEEAGKEILKSER